MSDKQIKAAIDYILAPYSQFFREERKQYVTEEQWSDFALETRESGKDDPSKRGFDIGTGFWLLTSANYSALYDYYLIGWCIHDKNGTDNKMRNCNKLRSTYINKTTALMHFREMPWIDGDGNPGLCRYNIPGRIIDATGDVIKIIDKEPGLINDKSLAQMRAQLVATDPECIIVVVYMHA